MKIQDAIDQLTADVEADKTVKASAVTFIKGVPALIQAAVDAAAADQPLTPAQASAFDNLKTGLEASTQELTDALSANTPNPNP